MRREPSRQPHANQPDEVGEEEQSRSPGGRRDSSHRNEDREDAVGQANHDPAEQERGSSLEQPRNGPPLFLSRPPCLREPSQGHEPAGHGEGCRPEQGEKATSPGDRFPEAGHQRASKVQPDGADREDLCPGGGWTHIGHQPPEAGIHEGGPDPLHDAHGQEGHAHIREEEQ